MPETKEVFRSTADATGDGIAIDSREEGQAEGDALSHAILAVKDQNGNLQYIPMNNGAIVVTNEGVGTLQQDQTEITYSGSGFDVLLSIPSNNGVTIKNLEVCVASQKDCRWQIVYVDDGSGSPVDTILKRFSTGAGNLTFAFQWDNFALDLTGGTGDQFIELRAEQQGGSNAKLDGDMSFLEY